MKAASSWLTSPRRTVSLRRKPAGRTKPATTGSAQASAATIPAPRGSGVGATMRERLVETV